MDGPPGIWNLCGIVQRLNKKYGVGLKKLKTEWINKLLLGTDITESTALHWAAERSNSGTLLKG